MVYNGSSGKYNRYNKYNKYNKYIKYIKYDKYNKARAIEINYKLAKFFHNNAIPFNIVESDELSDLVLALCPAYHQHGLPGRFWLSTTGVDLVYNGLREEVEGHLQRCNAVMANMDGWENEKKQQLKIVTETGKPGCLCGMQCIR